MRAFSAVEDYQAIRLRSTIIPFDAGAGPGRVEDGAALLSAISRWRAGVGADRRGGLAAAARPEEAAAL